MQCPISNDHVEDHEPDERDYAQKNDREDDRQRPEKPRRRVSFSDVLYGVVQAKSGRDSAQRGKKERGHKTIPVGTRAPVLPAVKSWPDNQNNVKNRNKIRNSQKQFP
jgi:hypothetical protein